MSADTESVLKNKTPADDKPKVETEQQALSDATVKISMDDPEMAMLPGGLFVASIPVNSKKVNRVIALGWAVLAVFKINGIYQEFEDLKKKNAERIRKGDLSLVKKLQEGICGLMGK